MLWWDDDETAAWAGELIDIVDDEQWGKAAAMATAMLPERKSDIDKAVLYAVRGVARAELGEHDSAIADFTRALEIDENDWPSFCGRGRAHQEQGKNDLALADFNRAIELNGEDAESHYHRATVYCDRKEYDLAVADLNKALELGDEDAVTYSLRGFVYDKLNERKKAAADFEKAAQLDPDLFASKAAEFADKAGELARRCRFKQSGGVFARQRRDLPPARLRQQHARQTQNRPRRPQPSPAPGPRQHRSPRSPPPHPPTRERADVI